MPLAFGVQMSWLRREIAEHIPTTWSDDNRSIAPGVVADVTLTRGEFDVALQGDVATLTMPVDMKLRIRSQLGAWVVPIGRCQSTIDVTVTASLRMNSDGALGIPNGQARIRHPCRFSSLDVTPFLQSEIDRQIVRAQRHLVDWQTRQQTEFNRIRSEVFARLAMHPRSPIGFCPGGLRQLEPTLQNGTVLSRFEIDGQVAKVCGDAPSFSVTAQTNAPSHPFHLAATVRIPWSELAASLTKHLTKPESFRFIASRSARRDGRDLVALLVRTPTLRGWILAQPTVTACLGTLTNWTADEPQLLADLKAQLAGFSFSIASGELEQLSNDIVDQLTAVSRIWGDQPEPTWPNVTDLETGCEVSVDRDGLVLTTHRQSRALAPAPIP